MIVSSSYIECPIPARGNIEQGETANVRHETHVSEPAPSPVERLQRSRAPRQALRDRVAAAIVAAAARVLTTDGPSTSMNDVAAAAGGPRATLYPYFPPRQGPL